MKIIIEPHTLGRAHERGANKDEIYEVISDGIVIPAKNNRYGKYKIFTFNHERNSSFYEQKRVEVYYTIENSTIITVTVYVFYGKWEE
ncbi:MAG: hypothetical protein WC868_12065 [Bacteroidales bacterium]